MVSSLASEVLSDPPETFIHPVTRTHSKVLLIFVKGISGKYKDFLHF